MSLGLALEGGGAKGAYQIGVLTALFEAGYKFDAVVGTSIGALNGAMVAQDKFEECKKIWDTIDFANTINFDNEVGVKLAKNSYTSKDVKYFAKSLLQIIKNRGIDNSQILNLIENNVDEELLRNSKIDFGLMTINAKSLKPMPMFKDEIPQGKVAQYILASANFPGFKKVSIDDIPYRDGGLYDNLPINMLVAKGYKDIVAIRTSSGKSLRIQKVEEEDVNITYFEPSEKPGRLFDFSPASIERAIKVGYFDGLRYTKGYKGNHYYLDIRDYGEITKHILDMDIEDVHNFCDKLNLEKNKEKILLIIDITNKLAELLLIKKFVYIGEIFVAILEELAAKYKIERLQILTVEKLINIISEKMESNSSKVKPNSFSERIKMLESFYTYFYKHLIDAKENE